MVGALLQLVYGRQPLLLAVVFVPVRNGKATGFHTHLLGGSQTLLALSRPRCLHPAQLAPDYLAHLRTMVRSLGSCLTTIPLQLPSQLLVLATQYRIRRTQLLDLRAAIRQRQTQSTR